MANAPRKDPPGNLANIRKTKANHPASRPLGTLRTTRSIDGNVAKDMDKDSVTLEQALSLLKAKAAKNNKGGKKSTSRRKSVDT